MGKWRRGWGAGGGDRPFRFSLSLVPRSTKGLFTGYKNAYLEIYYWRADFAFFRFFELLYRKLTMHVDNAKKIYVKQN